MQLLLAEDLDVTVQDRLLFHIDQLNIETGEKIALVGPNASGKTTFLNLIMEGAPPQGGGSLRRWGLWSYFAQKSPELPEMEDLEQASYWELQDILWRGDQNYSGGEEVRWRLARALSDPHDILVLDEPTAHLDQDGLAELRRQLAQEETYLLVSHDRELLNEFCDRTLVIEDGKLWDYPGTYDEWKEAYELERESQMHHYQQAVEEKKRLMAVAREQRRKASKTQRKPKKSASEIKAMEFGAVGKSIGGKQKSLSAQARNTEKRIERLGKIEKPRQLPVIRPDFEITDPPQNKIIVEIQDLNFAYPGQDLLFENLSFALKRNVRTALVGANGVGKSTLLNLIVHGHPGIRVVPKAKFGYFNQSFENISFEKSILENIHEVSVQDECVNRNVLVRMGFPASVLDKKAKVLSGGELTKLSFSKLFVSDVNVLLIDEPSNYLDIPSYEAIESLLLDFEGSMLFCSHDAYFLEKIAEEVWAIEGRGMTRRA